MPLLHGTAPWDGPVPAAADGSLRLWLGEMWQTGCPLNVTLKHHHFFDPVAVETQKVGTEVPCWDEARANWRLSGTRNVTKCVDLFQDSGDCHIRNEIRCFTIWPCLLGWRAFEHLGLPLVLSHSRKASFHPLVTTIDPSALEDQRKTLGRDVCLRKARSGTVDDMMICSGYYPQCGSSAGVIQIVVQWLLHPIDWLPGG